MSAIAPKVDLDIDAKNSCNWKCCLWCGHRVKSTRIDSRESIPRDNSESAFDVETTETTEKVVKTFEHHRGSDRSHIDGR